MSVIPRFLRLQKKITYVWERSPLHNAEYQFHLESWWVNIKAYLNFPLRNLENPIVKLNLNICRLSKIRQIKSYANRCKQVNHVNKIWIYKKNWDKKRDFCLNARKSKLALKKGLSSKISEIYKRSLIKNRITDIFIIQMFRLKRKKTEAWT